MNASATTRHQIQIPKLDYWCGSIIEAGWLACLVIAPLFFNTFSSRVFELDKISLIRSIGLLMLLAWLVKVADSGRLWRYAYTQGPPNRNRTQASEPSEDHETAPFITRLTRLWRTPFLLPILVLVLVYLISSVLSVAPRVSWWGSYQRLEGTYTFLSYVLIALLTATHLRSPAQIRRFQHAAIATSLPIALYAIVQHYGTDPLPWQGDVTVRSAANAGNPIFLAAYLLMALFLTLERIYASFAYPLGDSGSESNDEQQEISTVLAGGAYLFIFAAQVLAIFWTQSRGPVLALLVGLYLFGLLLLASLRSRRHRLWTAGWVGVGVVGVACLMLLNAPAVAGAVRSIPSLTRFAALLDPESNTAQVRLLIWEGTAKMLASPEPLVYPDGSQDAFHTLRPLVGYGPETLWMVYSPFYPPALGHRQPRDVSPDRAHNETWDVLATTGIFGLVAYMALAVSIFYWGLRWLGLIATRRDSTVFAALLGLFSLTFTLTFYRLDGGWRLFGLALPAGLMVGLATYVTYVVFFQPGIRPSRADFPRHLLLIALIATFTAHFVEIHFGIGVAATRTYFWLQTGLLLALGQRWAQPHLFAASVSVDETAEFAVGEVARNPTGLPQMEHRATGTTNRQLPPKELPALSTTVMTDLLVFLTFVFLYTAYRGGDTSAPAILWNSIVKRLAGGELVTSPAIIWLMLGTWLIIATLGLAADAQSRRRTPRLGWWLRGYGLHAAVVWGGWLVYGLIQAGRVAPGTGGTTLNSQLDHLAGHFVLYTLLVAGWLLLAATVYAWPWLHNRYLPAAGHFAVSAGTAVVAGSLALLGIGSINVAAVHADMLFKQGQQFEHQHDWLSSIELYRRALRVHRTEDHYMIFLGNALLAQAKQAGSEESFSSDAPRTFAEVLSLTPQAISQMGRFELLHSAEAVLEHAQRLNPLNTDNTVNLARLYSSWADLSGDSAMHQGMLDMSITQYNIAVQLSPTLAHLWNEKGSVHLARGEAQEAEAAYLQGLSLDRNYQETYLLLAELYSRRGNFERTIELLEEGITTLEADPRFHPSMQMVKCLDMARQRMANDQDTAKANLQPVEPCIDPAESGQ